MIDLAELRRCFRYNKRTGVLIRVYCRERPDICGIPVGQPMTPNGYLRFKFKGRSYLVHRVIWLLVTGEWPKNQIDHRNRLKGDNRWKNLRNATKSQNQTNCGPYQNNKCGVKGVQRRESGRYRAMVQFNKKLIRLGTYDTVQEAHAAYCVAAKYYFGEFARTK